MLAWSRGARLALPFLTVALAGCIPNAPVFRVQPTTTPTEQAPKPPPPLANGRLPDTARPLRYALSLWVNPKEPRFTGEVTIDVEIPRPTSHVVLHAAEIDLRRAQVVVGKERRPARTSTRPSAGQTTPNELVLAFEKPLPAGRASIEITYVAPFSEGTAGLFRVEDAGASYAFTQFEPVDARRVFPCFDEPGFKVPFDVKVTVPKGQLALSNAPETSRTASPDAAHETFTFATTEPLPTYLVAIAAGPFEIREAKTTVGGQKEPVRLRLVTTRGKAKLGELVLDTAARELAVLAGFFGREYPYRKLDLVAVPDLMAAAMEHPGLVTFREDLALLDPDAASAQGKQEMTSIVAHELAHQWFGNLVGPPWWDDLWLNEGLATWMTAKVVDTITKDTGAAASAVRDKHLAMKLDELPSARAVRSPVVSAADAEEIFDAITYEKGASLVRMLEGWLGEDVMKKGLAAHTSAHAHGTASTEVLLAALAEASGKDVAAVARPFLERTGVPFVRAELTCEAEKPPRVSLALTPPASRAGAGGEEARAFVVPACVAYEGGAAPVCGLLSDRLTLELPRRGCPSWIHPNADERGYYRFTLPRASWDALAKVAKKLAPTERVGLVANALALVRSGELGADALLELLSSLRGERNPAVLAEMTESLRWLRVVLPDSGSREALGRFVGSLFLPLGKELGWATRKQDDDATRLARVAVLEALGVLAEDPWTLRQAASRATAYLDDPRAIDADTTAVALLVAARTGGDERLQALRDAVRLAATPEERVIAARAIGRIGDPAELGRGLDIARAGELRAHEFARAFHESARAPETLSTSLGWIRARGPELAPRFGGGLLLELSSAVGEACDPVTRDDALRVFKAIFETASLSPKKLAALEEQANQCIAVRERETPRLRKKLGLAAR
ncbi:M1 family metallopeptidase [Polyangium sp. y55x31]|uniref:M1 family metallopeptidase n=1 Tax=Polyangium sp. y55x31 TaxID=3042688 RepID=UPI002482A455|nr:M1 family metallopeptidase [Polyangium sp. y55x31]MDI1479796.1 M1 family metallopeptidase [Polyangium sp. y55x31]